MATQAISVDPGVVGGAEFQVPQQPVQRDPNAKLYFGRFSERDLVDQVRRRWDDADTRLRDFFNIGYECWLQYRNKQDFSDKEDWQSKVTLAKAHAAVKQGVANIRRLFALAGNILTVEDPSGQNEFFAPYVEEGVKVLWDKAGFIEETSEALEAGLIMGLLAAREDWQYEDVFQIQPGIGQDGNPTVFAGNVKQGKLNLRAIDPWKLRWGPETGPGFIDWIIEERIISVATLRRLGFNIPQEMITEDQKPDESKEKRRDRLDEIEAREQFEKRAKIREYWGPLIDEKTQEVVVDQAHVISANGRFILLAEENQFWRKKPPYVLASPLRVAFRFPGQGILEVNRALKENIDVIAQMGSDYLKFSTLLMLEADMSLLENPEDVATGAEPGKIFRKRPGTGGVQALRQVPINPLQGDVFNMLLAQDKEYQRATFITEVVQGLLDTKGETTATEVQSTVTQSTIMLSSIARDLEEQYIEPLADMTWDYMLQFMDSTSNPNWTMIIGQAGQQLDMLSRPERMAIIQSNYAFRARGISMQVEKMQEVQKLIQYLQVLSTMLPQAIPLLNLPEIFKRIHEGFSFERRNELLSPNAMEMFGQMQQMMMASMNPAEQVAGKAGQELVSGLIQQALQQQQLEGQAEIEKQRGKQRNAPRKA